MVKINAYMDVCPDDAGVPVVRCSRCGETLGPASQSYKTFALEARRPLSALGPNYAPGQGGEERFELREYYCPSCLVLLDTDVALKGDASTCSCTAADCVIDGKVTCLRCYCNVIIIRCTNTTQTTQ